MLENVRIRSAQEYFDEFGREKLYKQGMPKDSVRKELVDAFHKEIFSLVAMRAKKRFSDIPKEGDPEALRIASNVIKDATKKWKKVVQMFETYSETSGCITLSDISIIPEEGNGEIGFDNGQLVTRASVMKDGAEEVDDNGEPIENESDTDVDVAVPKDISQEDEESGKVTDA